MLLAGASVVASPLVYSRFLGALEVSVRLMSSATTLGSVIGAWVCIALSLRGWPPLAAAPDIRRVFE